MVRSLIEADVVVGAGTIVVTIDINHVVSGVVVIFVTIDGKEQYTDWQDVEPLAGTFTGKWSLRFWSPEGDTGVKHNCLVLYATYDEESAKSYMAYSYVADFDYASETTLRIRGYYFNDEDGWANYQRGDAEPNY